MAEATRKPRRTKTGRVTSNKMDKTVVVEVEIVIRHRLYGRTMRRTRSFKAHDDGNRCSIGDTIVIAGHGASHELVEEWHGERGVPVVRAPNHAFGDQIAAHGAKRGDRSI